MLVKTFKSKRFPLCILVFYNALNLFVQKYSYDKRVFFTLTIILIASTYILTTPGKSDFLNFIYIILNSYLNS